MSADVLSIRKTGGIAGQVSYTATVRYEDEGPEVVTFVGSVYGAPGPVVMQTEGNPEGLFVNDPIRFGSEFNTTWVRRFFNGG